jgi:fructokinase
MIAVLGEAVVDLVRQPGGDFRPFLGGSPLNVAVGLGRLGRATRLYARISDDPFGAMFRAHLAESDVDDAGLVAAAEPSTLAVATIGADGSPRFDFWLAGTADWAWTPAELAAPLPAGALALHTGSLALELPPGRDVITDLLRREHDRGQVTISYDPNLRMTRRWPRADGVARVEATVALADLVKVSSEDLAWLCPGEDPADVAARWIGLGAGLVVVTLGGDGSLGLAAGGTSVRLPGRAVTVVDTVGAGDAFSAGLLDALAAAAILGPGSRARLAAIDPAALTAALDTAGAVAALTCTRPGADPPRRAVLDRFLRESTAGQEQAAEG